MPASYLSESAGAGRRRTSVRGEFLRLLIAVQVPILIVGLVQGLSSWSDTRRQQTDRLAENARAIAGLESNLLSGASAILGLLAEIPDIREAKPGCGEKLRQLNADVAAYSNLLRIATDGQILCSAIPAQPGMTYDKVSWWPSIGRGSETRIVGPIWGTLTQKPVLLAIKPLATADGGFDGALAVAIDVPHLQEAVRTRHLSGEGVVAIVDGNGAPIAASRPASLPTLDLSERPGEVHTAHDPKTGRSWSYAAAPMFRSIEGGQSVHVVFAEPHPTVFSAAWWRSLFVFVLPVLAVLLSSIAIWRGVDAVVLRWIVQLRKLAQAFARGEYRARAPGLKEAPAELRDFAADLHRMALAIEERDGRLQQALVEEQRLVREVHHRVRNNLQVMMSMLSLQAQRLAPGAGRLALEQARLRMSALALVYQLGYASGEQGTVSAATLLPELVSRFQNDVRESAGLTIVTDIADVSLALDTAVAISIWLSETLVHAMRHAYPEGAGEIRVRLVQDGRATLCVEDDGPGVAAGVDRSFGVRLTQAIARQLAGTSRIETLVGGGNLSWLEFPLHEDGRARIAREPAVQERVVPASL